MSALRRIVLLLACLMLSGCGKEDTLEEQARKHLESLRAAGLLTGNRGSAQVFDFRRIVPRATRWSTTAEPFCWAVLRTDDGDAGYLAWSSAPGHGLMDFALEGLASVETPVVRVLGGVPPIQQFPSSGADGKPVASGCVPTAAASLVAFCSTRAGFDWQAGDIPEGVVMRLRERMRMSVIPDLEGFADGRMALAGATTTDLVAALKEDAARCAVRVEVSSREFDFPSLRKEITDGRPALLTCMVLVPRKPELSWSHAVVAVGFAEIGGRPFVAVIDNYFEARIPGTVRWIAAERCRELVFVRPVR